MTLDQECTYSSYCACLLILEFLFYHFIDFIQVFDPFKKMHLLLLMQRHQHFLELHSYSHFKHFYLQIFSFCHLRGRYTPYNYWFLPPLQITLCLIIQERIWEGFVHLQWHLQADYTCPCPCSYTAYFDLHSKPETTGVP